MKVVYFGLFRGAFWEPFGSLLGGLWRSFGALWAPLGSLWRSSGILLGAPASPGLSLGSLWCLFVYFGLPLLSFCVPGAAWGRSGLQFCYYSAFFVIFLCFVLFARFFIECCRMGWVLLGMPCTLCVFV